MIVATGGVASTVHIRVGGVGSTTFVVGFFARTVNECGPPGRLL